MQSLASTIWPVDLARDVTGHFIEPQILVRPSFSRSNPLPIIKTEQLLQVNEVPPYWVNLQMRANIVKQSVRW